MKVQLVRDLYVHENGEVTKYLAGTTPDLPKHLADLVIRSIIEQRRRTRANALKFSTTVESKRARSVSR